MELVVCRVVWCVCDEMSNLVTLADFLAEQESRGRSQRAS
jgi:hypothetical protein